MLLIFLKFANSSPHYYQPDVRIGIKKKAPICKQIVDENSHVFCHIVAQVVGQAIPLVNTYTTGQMASLKMNSPSIIRGIRKGLIGACQGEIRKITIPPGYAYKESYIDGLFPPDSSWYVEIEVVEVMAGDSV